jgi:hypothetical protein
MTIQANNAEIDSLLKQLYEHKRQLQSNGVQNPTFVFFCAKEERHKVERRFREYFNSKYGLPPWVDSSVIPERISYAGTSSRASFFHFPQNDASIVLLTFEP